MFKENFGVMYANFKQFLGVSHLVNSCSKLKKRLEQRQWTLFYCLHGWLCPNDLPQRFTPMKAVFNFRQVFFHASNQQIMISWLLICQILLISSSVVNFANLLNWLFTTFFIFTNSKKSVTTHLQKSFPTEIQKFSGQKRIALLISYVQARSLQHMAVKLKEANLMWKIIALRPYPYRIT